MMKMKLVRSIVPKLAMAAALAAAFHGSPVLAESVALQFVPAHTKVEFTLADVLHTVHGSFALERGDITFDTATGKSTGEWVVDAASGDSGSGARDRRMHQNVLESGRYPEIVFRPDHLEGKVAPQGVSQVWLHGTFSIHGAGHEITVPVTVDVKDGLYTVTASFAVPYVKWGMKNPSTLFLRVSDHVDITIHASACVH